MKMEEENKKLNNINNDLKIDIKKALEELELEKLNLNNKLKEKENDIVIIIYNITYATIC